ncbi:MAG: MFS transporter [Actinomycetota bacterium]
MTTRSTVHPARPSGRSVEAHSWGFWVAAVAFLFNMAFSAVPTPLYAIYAARDGLDNVAITVVYAVYAAGVIASLFFGGHISDWIGRKAVFVPALLVNVASAVIFMLWPSFAGLLVARVVSGVSVGLTTATATAYLSELHLGARPNAPGRRAQVIATAANLGGIGLGPLIAGILAQYAPAPLELPYFVFAVSIAALAMLVASSPETALLPDPVPRYRPQRIAVPRATRGMFFGATAAGIAAFAVFGVFNSLVPTFLVGTLHETSHAIAGAVAFAAFAAGAGAQIALSRWETRTMLRRSIPILALGLTLFAAGMWVPNVIVFVIGGVLTGAGAGLVFRAAMVTAGAAALPDARAEVLAGFFLGAYVGLSVPVIGLGVATVYWPAREVMLVFIALVLVALIAAVAALTKRAVPRTPRLSEE